MDKIEKIRQEIERQMNYYDEKEMKAWDDCEQGDEDALWYQGHRKMCSKLLSFLDTLSEEPDKGLEEEISRTYHNGSVADTSDMDHIDYENIAHHFAEWQKQQMLKDAVEATVMATKCGDKYQQLLITDWNSSDGLHNGDKVRIIIVKEDEK